MSKDAEEAKKTVEARVQDSKDSTRNAISNRERSSEAEREGSVVRTFKEERKKRIQRRPAEEVTAIKNDLQIDIPKM